MDKRYIKERMDRLRVEKLPGISISGKGDDVSADEFVFLEVPPCPRPKTPRKNEEAGCSAGCRERHNPTSPTPSSSRPNTANPVAGYSPASPRYRGLTPNTANPVAGYSPASSQYRGLTPSPDFSPASPDYFSDASTFTYSLGYSPTASPTFSTDDSDGMSPGLQAGFYSPASPPYLPPFANWQYSPPTPPLRNNNEDNNDSDTDMVLSDDDDLYEIVWISSDSEDDWAEL